MPSYLLDAELDDETIGRSLYSPLFTQDREEPAGQRQAHHSFEEKFVASSVLFHTHKNGETRARTWFAKFVQTKNQVAKWKTNESGFSLKDKKSKFSLISEQKLFINTNIKPSLMGEVSQELSGIIESQRREIDHTHARDEQLRRDQQLFMNNYWNKVGIFVMVK